MLLSQVSDRKLFLHIARKHDAEILVVRSTTVLPEFEGIEVHWVPALALQYSFRWMEGRTEHRWIYREEKPDLTDRADFSGTLWEKLVKLRRRGKVKVKLHHRTGSF